MAVKRVAIVGGGLGGLVAAVYLQGRRHRDTGDTFTCDLFEASGRIGGNMFSAYLDRAYRAPFADLAVNDFNAKTYLEMMRLIGKLERDGLPVPTGKLIDEDCYFTARGQGEPALSYTSDELAHPERHYEKPYLRTLHADWARFTTLAAQVMKDEKYATMSVDDFVKTEGFSEDFARLMLLPRINAMYFMTEGHPGRMPIRGVMFYYHLQEGLGAGQGAPAPERLFFAQGASQWARQLERYVLSRRARVHLDAPATVALDPAGGPPTVTWRDADGNARSARFDAVVCAVPPHLVKDVVPGMPREFLDGLEAFGCYPATAYVHDDERVMPAERSRWRTYNVLIEKDEDQPYTISYVNKMHNGEDAKTPPFVTENPIVDIPPARVYAMADLTDPAGKRRVPAVARFTHNTVSVETMAFQAKLDGYQNHRGNGVYFTGGWTNGAGLQEQIIVASKDVCARIRGHHHPDLSPRYRNDGSGYVPHYLRKTLGIAKPGDDYPDAFYE